MSRHSTAHHFLEGLVDLGVDYIFANLGTDHVSLIDRPLARCSRSPEAARHRIGNSSDEFARILASDIARWTEVAKAGNVKMEQ